MMPRFYQSKPTSIQGALHNDRYVGYMQGSGEQVARALELMSLWQPTELTEAEVLARSEIIQPVNSTTADGRFVDGAVIDENGRVQRLLSFQAF